MIKVWWVNSSIILFSLGSFFNAEDCTVWWCALCKTARSNDFALSAAECLLSGSQRLALICCLLHGDPTDHLHSDVCRVMPTYLSLSLDDAFTPTSILSPLPPKRSLRLWWRGRQLGQHPPLPTTTTNLSMTSKMRPMRQRRRTTIEELPDVLWITIGHRMIAEVLPWKLLGFRNSARKPFVRFCLNCLTFPAV